MSQSFLSNNAARLGITDPRTGWSLAKCERIPLVDFDCGDADLNEWFRVDVLRSSNELMTQTFEVIDPQGILPQTPIALVSVCNDALLLRDVEDNMPVPEGKRFPTWPAVKIARLGVANEWQRRGIGTQAIDLVKQLFVSENRTGCRILTVDAYARQGVALFYRASDFEFLSSRDIGQPTRSMWFDLKRMLNPPSAEESSDSEAAFE